MNYSRNLRIRRKQRMRKRKRNRNILFTIITILFLMLIASIIAIRLTPDTDTLVHADSEPVQTIQSTPKPIEPVLINMGEYKLTAYCPCMKCCGKTDGITASGVQAVQGVTIAADTSVLPFDTVVIIGGKEYIVQDVGGAIKGNKIDIYFDNHQEALDFGVQYADVFVKKGEI